MTDVMFTMAFSLFDTDLPFLSPLLFHLSNFELFYIEINTHFWYFLIRIMHWRSLICLKGLQILTFLLGAI